MENGAYCYTNCEFKTNDVETIIRVVSQSTGPTTQCNMFHCVAFFLLGESTAAEFCVPTFRNTLYHLQRRCKFLPTHSLWRWERHSVPKRRAYKILAPGNCPEESTQHLQTWRKFEIKNISFLCQVFVINIFSDDKRSVKENSVADKSLIITCL